GRRRCGARNGGDSGLRLAAPRIPGPRSVRVGDPYDDAVALTQYYTATTLDGFIADPDNSLEWLFSRAQDKDGPQNYPAFIEQIGALAMGATTYEWILDNEG